MIRLGRPPDALRAAADLGAGFRLGWRPLVNWPSWPPDARCGGPPADRAWFLPVWADHAVVRAMCVTRWAWGLAEAVGTLANLAEELV